MTEPPTYSPRENTAAGARRPTSPPAPTQRAGDEPTVPVRQRTDEPARAWPAGRPGTAPTIDPTATQRAEAAARAERAEAAGQPQRLYGTTADDDRTQVLTPEQDRTPDTPAGPRPRASMLATLALIAGVAAALLVLSGPLLGYGIGVGGLAVLLSVFGLAATRRRHVAGKADAFIGLLLGLGAIVVGILALTGSLPWLGTDMDSVSRLREWLDTQFINRIKGNG